MNLTFELGHERSPAGHALIYFTSASGGEILATYVVCLPIVMNMEKYVPPAFAPLVGSHDIAARGGVPMPPVVETVESVAWLTSLASSRADDLVNAGMLYSVDLPNVMQMTAEAASNYGDLYSTREMLVHPPSPNDLSAYGDLTEGERLGEITKLVGLMRDEPGTPRAQDARDELRLLSATMPSKYRMDELLDWAGEPGETGQLLATLHLRRSYKLLNEEYLDVAEIEREIGEVQARQSAD